jgi:hypothetical protein
VLAAETRFCRRVQEGIKDESAMLTVVESFQENRSLDESMESFQSLDCLDRVLSIDQQE